MRVFVRVSQPLKRSEHSTFKCRNEPPSEHPRTIHYDEVSYISIAGIRKDIFQVPVHAPPTLGVTGVTQLPPSAQECQVDGGAHTGRCSGSGGVPGGESAETVKHRNATRT